MSRSINKVMLLGNVGADPEVRFIPSGVPVASFRMATSESYKDKDGHLHENTEWHNIVAWRGWAESVQRHVVKGSRIFVEGKLHTRSYEDKEGVKRYIAEVVADNIILLDARTGAKDNQSDSRTSEDLDHGSTSDHLRSGSEIPF